jgi:hypothetical protein
MACFGFQQAQSAREAANLHSDAQISTSISSNVRPIELVQGALLSGYLLETARDKKRIKMRVPTLINSIKTSLIAHFWPS